MTKLGSAFLTPTNRAGGRLRKDRASIAPQQAPDPLSTPALSKTSRTKKRVASEEAPRPETTRKKIAPPSSTSATPVTSFEAPSVTPSHGPMLPPASLPSLDNFGNGQDWLDASLKVLKKKEEEESKNKKKK